MAIRIRGQVKDQIRALIKAHPDWMAEEIVEATKACFPGEVVGGKSTVSALRIAMGMGRFQKRTTQAKIKAVKSDEQLRFIPASVEGKVRLLKEVAEELEKQVAAQANGRDILRRFAEESGPGHPVKGLYREVR